MSTESANLLHKPMANTTQLPITTGRYASGTGVLISTLQNFQDSSEEPTTLLRFVLKDPEVPATIDVGVPRYQTCLVKSFYADALTTGPSHVMLMHCDKIDKILAVPVFQSGDWTATDTWLRTYADITAVAAGGTALTCVPVLEPVTGPPDDYLTTVLSVPTGSDKLGVTVIPKAIDSNVVGAAPGITGTDLGFSGSELTDWRWVGFVSRRDDTDPDIIHVLGHLEKTDVVRVGPGDFRSSANYVFSVKESTALLESTAEQVTVDVPFTPHQLAEGTPISISGPSEKTFWCIGRADPEYVNPSLTHRLESVVATNALTLASAMGIWASKDPELKTWQRIWKAPIGISSPPVHHLDDSVVDHAEISRDLGLIYHPVWQRLIPFGIDNDSGQDPVVETPVRSKQPAA